MSKEHRRPIWGTADHIIFMVDLPSDLPDWAIAVAIHNGWLTTSLPEPGGDYLVVRQDRLLYQVGLEERVQTIADMLAHPEVADPGHLLEHTGLILATAVNPDNPAEIEYLHLRVVQGRVMEITRIQSPWDSNIRRLSNANPAT